MILVFLPRTDKQMKRIAYKQLGSYLTDYDLKGPIIEKANNQNLIFQWYKVLSWGDTASIFIQVSPYLTSLTWRDRYFWPAINMNHQWNYLLGPITEFKEVLPLNFNKKDSLATQLRLDSNHKTNTDSTKLLITPDKLFFFLKEGYFRVLDKKKDYTIVGFHEPIADVFYNNGNKKDTLLTPGAAIFVNETSEILIVPYRVPDELW